MAKELETMTVGELKEYLNQFPDSARVVYLYPSGDYWRHSLVSSIKCAEYGTVVYSEYHRTHQLLDDDERDDDEQQKGEEVLILGS